MFRPRSAHSYAGERFALPGDGSITCPPANEARPTTLRDHRSERRPPIQAPIANPGPNRQSGPKRQSGPQPSRAPTVNPGPARQSDPRRRPPPRSVRQDYASIRFADRNR
ncbi:hypothetical protein GCM10009535_47710 [Streptomyces thermocarboxydovorans]|uniref:Uncharacterized protein n=1 Tax=Streptomyces thermocarboxydovorans TaxID=59298 RepID=A0ABP3SVY8_9ACTN